MSFLKELFSAYYDNSSNKITNCKENSLVWFHERRHQIQEEKFGLITKYSGWHIVGLILIAWLKDASTWIIAAFFVLYLFALEVDAWIYAFYKKNRPAGKKER